MRSTVQMIAGITVFACLALLWLLWPYLNSSWHDYKYAGAENGVAEHGQFGDSFGSLNSLFSGLAFFGTIAALLLQHRALNLQVNQFNETQKHQQLVDEMNALQAALERVDDKLQQTEGAINQTGSAAQKWELGQRQVWMEQRRTLENRLAAIGEILGWKLPLTTPPAKM